MNAADNVTCDLCDHKQKRVRAANVCSECDNLQICKECSTAQGKNKATKGHILTPLLKERQCEVSMCKMHHKLLVHFCLTCETLICKICVSLDHGDHDIERLANIVKSKVDEVRVVLEAQKAKRKDLQQLKKELTLLNANGKAPLVDKRDNLIKEIEEHAQKCFEQIITWRENLKKRVERGFKLIQDIPVGLEKVSKMAEKIDRPINTAAQLLLEIEEHPVYLDKLLSVQQEFQAIPQGEDFTEEMKFQSQLFNLNSDNLFFSPDTVQPSYGKILKHRTLGNMAQEIVQYKVKVDSEDMFIPSVAVLGSKYYAVAHPVRPGLPAEAIDIYELSGTLIRKTLRYHVPPMYDMSSTPDGKIAVLSGGTGGRNCCVKLFDAEAGYIRSTKEIDVKPLSLGVTLHDQFVILGVDKHGGKKIAVVDNDGAVQHAYCVIDSKDGYVSNTITCGGRFIFVNGYPKVSVYEIQATGLKKLAACFPEVTGLRVVMDVAATTLDNLFLTKYINESGKKSVYLSRLQVEQSKLEWGNEDYKLVQSNVSMADEAKVATRDGHTVVVSYGQTIRVFRC